MVRTPKTNHKVIKGTPISDARSLPYILDERGTVPAVVSIAEYDPY